jgi:hypothetical protein
MKGYWKYLMMACCVLERSVAGNCRTGGDAGGHSVCKTACAARKLSYCSQNYVLCQEGVSCVKYRRTDGCNEETECLAMEAEQNLSDKECSGFLAEDRRINVANTAG